MQSYVLNQSVNLVDLVKRSRNDEDLYLLTGKRPKLAFNPVSSLTLYWHDIDINKIKDFCDRSQSNNQLVVGFFSYELGLHTHNLTSKNKPQLPIVQLYSFEDWLEENDGKVEVKYQNSEFLETVKKWAEKPEVTPSSLATDTAFEPAWNIARYKTAFDKVKNYIKSGDIYQINLTYPLVATTASNTKNIFTQLQESNQANMAGLFQAPDFDLISLSPETFINITGGHIETFPIKGTRAKKEGVEDDLIIKDLLNDKKERAELNMISDLLRNDLSIVCKPDSVKIRSNQKTTKLDRVIHTYSHITGEVNAGVSSIEALIKVFPGGSISGCPKKRALEIIDEVEEYSRGAYTGSLFTLDPEDNLDANILIRTLIKKDQTISLPIGGGVVFDSTCQNEYQETLDKSLSITSAFKR